MKQELSTKTSQPVERHTLIFSGKILKDADNLSTLNIKDGMALHLVIRNQTTTPSQPPRANIPATTSSASSTPRPSTQPQPSSLPRNPLDMMGNPEMMQQMLNNPLLQNMMSNPQFIQSMIGENPQIQQLIQSHPELGHMLNDPEIMRQTMEMMRNPSMFNEMMRNHDQAIRNLQGIPGGEAALQRLYSEVQEPLMNSTVGALGGNPFAAQNNSTPVSSRSENAGVQNASALPNPWGGNSNSSSTSTNPSSTQSPFGALGGLDSPMMQQMMQSMMSSFGAANNQSSTNSANTSSSSNPLMANMNQILEQMNNPTFLNAMRNERVMEAIQQISQSLQVIRTEAPELANLMGGPMTALMGVYGNGASAANPNEDDLMRMMQSLGMGVSGGQNSSVSAEERYASQLEQLQAMGFNNRADNLAALSAVLGDLNAAIERLLQR